MQHMLSRLIQEARHDTLGSALGAIRQGAAELSQPRPDSTLVDGTSHALEQIIEACGLTEALRLAELIRLVEHALGLVRESQGRVLLAPYLQAMVLDLERAVLAFTTGSSIQRLLEHARELSQSIERWQPEQLILLDAYERFSSDGGEAPEARESPVLKLTNRLSLIATGSSHRGTGWLAGGLHRHDAHLDQAEEGKPHPRATIGEILSTADMLLTALSAMPTRLELLDALYVCAHTIVDMVTGLPGPLPQLAAAAAELLSSCRAQLVAPDDHHREYLRTLWLMSSLLLATPDPPRALLSAVDNLLAEPPPPPRADSRG